MASSSCWSRNVPALKCKTLYNRIEVKKLLIAFIFVVIVDLAYAQYGFWKYAERIDAITDKNSSYIINFKEDIGFGSSGLTLLCDGENNRQIQLSSDGYSNTENSLIVYRFDKNKPVEGKWDYSTNGQTALMPEFMIKPFIKSAKNSKILVARGKGSYMTYHIVSFEMMGFNSAIQKLVCFKGY